MRSSDLKNTLLKKIQEIDDHDLMDHINDIINLHNREGIYQLSKSEEQQVNEGLRQYHKNETLSHEESEIEINKWFDQQGGQESL